MVERNVVLNRIYLLLKYCRENNIDINNMDLNSVVKIVVNVSGLKRWAAYQYARYLIKIYRLFR